MSRGMFEDLTGMTFGDYTVIRRATKDEINKRGTYWLCRCSCGKERYVMASNLKTGRAKSCGHNGRGRYENLTGKTFGELTVLREVKDMRNRTQRAWECKCSCGNVKLCHTNDLKRGYIKTCGDRKLHNNIFGKEKSYGDLTGKRFGHLTILGLANKDMWKFGHKSWTCICDCGNETIKDTHQLISNKYKTCGCRMKSEE